MNSASACQQHEAQRPCCGRSCRSGQALVEFVFVLGMMVLLLFGLIDFFRASLVTQVIKNLSREGANLTSRGVPTPITLDSLVESAKPLSVNDRGLIILTAVARSGDGTLAVVSQETRGSVEEASRVGSVGSNKISLPVDVLPVPNQTLYVAEVFYEFSPITPLGTLLGIQMNRVLYDVAYF